MGGIASHGEAGAAAGYDIESAVAVVGQAGLRLCSCPVGRRRSTQLIDLQMCS